MRQDGRRRDEEDGRARERTERKKSQRGIFGGRLKGASLAAEGLPRLSVQTPRFEGKPFRRNVTRLGLYAPMNRFRELCVSCFVFSDREAALTGSSSIGASRARRLERLDLLGLATFDLIERIIETERDTALV